MMNLAEYRQPHARASPTSCPGRRWSTKGVVLNKDGSFQRTARFRGPDLDSRDAGRAGRRSTVAAQQRAAPSRLRLGDLRRGAAGRLRSAIRAASFPMPTSALVDAERRAQFEEEGAHFESRYFLTLLWLPPADDAARAEAWLYEGRAQRRR